jgi:transcription antitermination factor NusA-like protein
LPSATGGQQPIMGRKVLVVSTVEGAEDRIRDALGDDVDEVKVVVPAVRQGVLDWLASDQKAFEHAREEAGRTAEALPGETVEAVAGEADVELAIRDALATFPADEVVVAVRPEDDRSAVEKAATDVAERTIDGVPVREFVVTG